MRRILLTLFLLLTACATAPATSDFDVQIAQNDDGHPPRVGTGVHHIGLDLTVTNRTPAEWTVEGVSVETVGTKPFAIPKTSERWDERLGPGEAKTFHNHWPASATVGFGTREIPIRIELHLVAADGTRRIESFVR